MVFFSDLLPQRKQRIRWFLIYPKITESMSRPFLSNQLPLWDYFMLSTCYLYDRLNSKLFPTQRLFSDISACWQTVYSQEPIRKQFQQVSPFCHADSLDVKSDGFKNWRWQSHVEQPIWAALLLQCLVQSLEVFSFVITSSYITIQLEELFQLVLLWGLHLKWLSVIHLSFLVYMGCYVLHIQLSFSFYISACLSM